MSSSLHIHEPLVPPINFAMACPGVYRSGYPTKKNYPFLRALRLRSVLYLCPEDYAESNLKFCEENAIHVLRFPTEGNKEPFTDISERLMHRIMSALVDVRNLPLLIHCNKGKHRTGTVVAALRLLQGWSLVSIFEEYQRFAGDKARVSDQMYIELYYPIIRITPPYVAAWLTVTPRVRVVYSERELIEEENAQLGHSLLAPVNPHADAVHVAAVAAAVAAKTGTGGGSASPAPAGRHKDAASTVDLANAPSAVGTTASAAPSTTPPVTPGSFSGRGTSSATPPVMVGLPPRTAAPTAQSSTRAESGAVTPKAASSSTADNAAHQTAAGTSGTAHDADAAENTSKLDVPRPSSGATAGVADGAATTGASPRATNIRPSTKKAAKK